MKLAAAAIASLSLIALASCSLASSDEGEAVHQVKMEDRWNVDYQKKASKLDGDNAAVKDSLDNARKECEALGKQVGKDFKLQMVGVTMNATHTSTSIGRLSCDVPQQPQNAPQATAPKPPTTTPPPPSPVSPVPAPVKKP